MRWHIRQMVTSVAICQVCLTAYPQVPFSLDTAFRTVIMSQYVNSLLVRGDGQIITSGMIRFPGDMSIRGGALLNTDGTRDPNFADVAFMGGKITPWSDRMYCGNGQGLRRLWLDGYVDTGFDMVNAPGFSILQGGDYHVFPDGRVLISGKHTLNDPAHGFVGNYNLIWFTNTGCLDTTRIHRQGNGVLNKLKVLPSGGFIISGSCSQFEGVPVDGVFRTDAGGVPDTTFHSGVFSGSANDYLPLADGRVYICGRYRTTHALEDSLHLARFLPDGTLDPTFDIPHFTLGSLPNTGGLGPIVISVRRWGGGQLLVTGRFQFVNGLPRRGICVLDTTGVITDEFDDCGVGPFTYMGLTNASPYGLVTDADSTHYYIWGSYTGYGCQEDSDTLQRFVTRLHVGDITTNITAKPALQWSVYPNPTSEVATLAVEALPRNATVVIRDALGREVQRHRVVSYYTTFQLQPLPNGIYHIELYSDRERIGMQRLVVQH